MPHVQYPFELECNPSSSKQTAAASDLELRKPNNERRTLITYGCPQPQRDPRNRPSDPHALQFSTPRPLRRSARRLENEIRTPKLPFDDGRSDKVRLRSPPPAPRPQRLPTPDLSDIECERFCTCCKSKTEDAQHFKVKSKRVTNNGVLKGRNSIVQRQIARTYLCCSLQLRVLTAGHRFERF